MRKRESQKYKPDGKLPVICSNTLRKSSSGRTILDQQLDEARRRASEMEPNLRTPWHSFWSWVVIQGHVRLALVTLAMPLISVLLFWEACFPGPRQTAASVETTWQLAGGVAVLSLMLLVGTIIAWRRWEHKVRVVKPPPGETSKNRRD